MDDKAEKTIEAPYGYFLCKDCNYRSIGIGWNYVYQLRLVLQNWRDKIIFHPVLSADSWPDLLPSLHDFLEVHDAHDLYIYTPNDGARGVRRLTASEG